MQVVVDTLSPWDKEKLTAALKECIEFYWQNGIFFYSES